MSALADLGVSASILSFDLAIKLNMKIEDKGEATLIAALYKFMDVRGIGEVIVDQQYGYPYTMEVLA